MLKEMKDRVRFIVRKRPDSSHLADALLIDHSKHDEDENQKSAPPAKEEIRYHSIFVAECFPPSLTKDLIESVRRLGWGQDTWHRVATTNQPLDVWIDGQRAGRSTPSWINIGLIANPNDKSWLTPVQRASLPTSVSHAYARLHHLFPGLFVLVMQFVLDDDPGEEITSGLFRSRQTRMDTDSTSQKMMSPISLKQESVEAIRSQMQQACTKWLAKSVPGAFAELQDPGSFPVCDVVSFDIGTIAMSNVRRPWGHYIDTVLRLGRTSSIYRSDFLNGFYLQLPDYDDEKWGMRLVGNTDAVFSSVPNHYGDSQTRHALTSRLNEFSTTFTRWALYALLDSYADRYALARDNLTRMAREEMKHADLTLNREFESTLLKVSGDARAITSEAVVMCLDTHVFGHNVFDFEPADPFWRRLPAPDPSPLNLVDRHGKILRFPTQSDPAFMLFESLRKDIIRRCQWLDKEDLRSRELAQSLSASASATAQDKLARTNIGLQIVVVLLTIVVLLFTAIQVYLVWAS